MHLGSLSEDFLAEVFKLDHPGYEVEKCQETWTLPEYPRFRATPDNLVREPSGEIGVLETWMISSFRQHQFDAEQNLSPEEKIAQAQWQLFLSPEKLNFAWIQAFMGNGERQSPANRYVKDDTLIAMMVERAERWLWHVDNDTPPETRETDEEDVLDYVLRFQKKIKGKTTRLGGHEHALINRYFELNKERLEHDQQSKRLKEKQSAIKNELLLALGDAEVGLVNGYTVYLDDFKRAGYTTQPIDRKVVAIKATDIEPKKKK